MGYANVVMDMLEPLNIFLSYSTYLSILKVLWPLYIADITGRVLLEQRVNGNETVRINTINIQNGYYVLTYLNKENVIETKSIIIQH